MDNTKWLESLQARLLETNKKKIDFIGLLTSMNRMNVELSRRRDIAQSGSPSLNASAPVGDAELKFLDDYEGFNKAQGAFKLLLFATLIASYLQVLEQNNEVPEEEIKEHKELLDSYIGMNTTLLKGPIFQLPEYLKKDVSLVNTITLLEQLQRHAANLEMIDLQVRMFDEKYDVTAKFEGQLIIRIMKILGLSRFSDQVADVLPNWMCKSRQTIRRMEGGLLYPPPRILTRNQRRYLDAYYTYTNQANLETFKALLFCAKDLIEVSPENKNNGTLTFGSDGPTRITNLINRMPSIKEDVEGEKSQDLRVVSIDLDAQGSGVFFPEKYEVGDGNDITKYQLDKEKGQKQSLEDEVALAKEGCQKAKEELTTLLGSLRWEINKLRVPDAKIEDIKELDSFQGALSEDKIDLTKVDELDLSKLDLIQNKKLVEAIKYSVGNLKKNIEGLRKIQGGAKIKSGKVPLEKSIWNRYSISL